MKTSTLRTVLLLAACGTSAFAQSTAAPAQADADPIIVSGTGVSIRKSEFEGALRTLPAEYQQYARGAGKRQFAEDYLRMKLLAQAGLKDGLDRSPDVVAQLALMKENLVANAAIQKMEKAITFSDAELKAAYDAEKSQHETAKARHILIAFKGSPAAQANKPELSDAQAKAKAEDLRRQIVGGADFAALAKKESDDTGSGAQGGDLGEFGRGQMVPEFEQVAFESPKGAVAPVVRTQFGYHIVQVQERGVTPLENVRPALEKKLRQAKLQTQLDALKNNAGPKFDDAYFPAPAAAPSASAAPKK